MWCIYPFLEVNSHDTDLYNFAFQHYFEEIKNVLGTFASSPAEHKLPESSAEFRSLIRRGFVLEFLIVTVLRPVLNINQPDKVLKWYKKLKKYEKRKEKGGIHKLMAGKPPKMPKEEEVFQNPRYMEFLQFYFKIATSLGAFQEMGLIYFELMKDEMFGEGKKYEFDSDNVKKAKPFSSGWFKNVVLGCTRSQEPSGDEYEKTDKAEEIKEAAKEVALKVDEDIIYADEEETRPHPNTEADKPITEAVDDYEDVKILKFEEVVEKEPDRPTTPDPLRTLASQLHASFVDYRDTYSGLKNLMDTMEPPSTKNEDTETHDEKSQFKEQEEPNSSALEASCDSSRINLETPLTLRKVSQDVVFSNSRVQETIDFLASSPGIAPGTGCREKPRKLSKQESTENRKDSFCSNLSKQELMDFLDEDEAVWEDRVTRQHSAITEETQQSMTEEKTRLDIITIGNKEERVSEKEEVSSDEKKSILAWLSLAKTSTETTDHEITAPISILDIIQESSTLSEPDIRVENVGKIDTLATQLSKEIIYSTVKKERNINLGTKSGTEAPDQTIKEEATENKNTNSCHDPQTPRQNSLEKPDSFITKTSVSASQADVIIEDNVLANDNENSNSDEAKYMKREGGQTLEDEVSDCKANQLDMNNTTVFLDPMNTGMYDIELVKSKVESVVQCLSNAECKEGLTVSEQVVKSDNLIETTVESFVKSLNDELVFEGMELVKSKVESAVNCFTNDEENKESDDIKALDSTQSTDMLGMGGIRLEPVVTSPINIKNDSKENKDILSVYIEDGSEESKEIKYVNDICTVDTDLPLLVSGGIEIGKPKVESIVSFFTNIKTYEENGHHPCEKEDLSAENGSKVELEVNVCSNSERSEEEISSSCENSTGDINVIGFQVEDMNLVKCKNQSAVNSLCNTAQFEEIVDTLSNINNLNKERSITNKESISVLEIENLDLVKSKVESLVNFLDETENSDYSLTNSTQNATFKSYETESKLNVDQNLEMESALDNVKNAEKNVENLESSNASPKTLINPEGKQTNQLNTMPCSVELSTGGIMHTQDISGNNTRENVPGYLNIVSSIIKKSDIHQIQRKHRNEAEMSPDSEELPHLVDSTPENQMREISSPDAEPIPNVGDSGATVIFEFIAENIDQPDISATVQKYIEPGAKPKLKDQNCLNQAIQNIENRISYLGWDGANGRQENVIVKNTDLCSSQPVISLDGSDMTLEPEVAKHLQTNVNGCKRALKDYDCAKGDVFNYVKDNENESPEAKRKTEIKNKILEHLTNLARAENISQLKTDENQESEKLKDIETESGQIALGKQINKHIFIGR